MNLSDPLSQNFVEPLIIGFLTIAICLLLVYKMRKKDKQLMLDKTIHKPNSETSLETLRENVQKIEREKEALSHELRKLKRKPRGTIGYILLVFGVTALATSILFESTVLAFIGLGLAFWGISLTFIRPSRYVKADILDSASISSLATIDRIISDLGYQGKAIYLPPRHLKEFRNEKVYVPSKKNAQFPSPEEVAGNKVFLNPHGMCIVPPGLALANLLERELKTDFVKVDLSYLQNNLPKLLIEDLEIVESFEMDLTDQMVQVKIAGDTFRNFCREASQLPNVCSSLGCPFCSSIAVALTRATGKPVFIEKSDRSAEGKAIEIKFRIIEGY